MKDLIAKLKSDATCAMGALYMHIDAQAARIAELEAQIAAASAPVVEPKYTFSQNDDKGCYEVRDILRNHVADIFYRSDMEAFQRALGASVALQSADTDKLREALKLAVRQNSCDMLMTGEEIRKCEAALNSTALQAPVREVPEPEPDMLWEADEPEDGVTGNSPKDFAENYAAAAVGRGETHDVEVLCCNRTHNRTMRVTVSADEDAENWLHWEWVDALPATPVQEPSNG